MAKNIAPLICRKRKSRRSDYPVILSEAKDLTSKVALTFLGNDCRRDDLCNLRPTVRSLDVCAARDDSFVA